MYVNTVVKVLMLNIYLEYLILSLCLLVTLTGLHTVTIICIKIIV